MKLKQQTRVEGRSASALLRRDKESRTESVKYYEPVREFERQTSYCPLYLAWHMVDEAHQYFRTELIPSSGSATFSHPMGKVQLADKLARRAEAVFAKQPFWQRKYKSANGRGYILSSMRHWLAGVLANENPVLFHQLPESFKIGLPLPENPAGGAAAPPYQKPKMVGPTCRSASIAHGSRGSAFARLRRDRRSPHHPLKPRFVHGGELLAM